MMGIDFWLKFLNGTWLGGFEGFLVRNCGGEVLVRSYGFLVRRSGKGYLSVHQTVPGSGDVWIGCFGGLGGRQTDQRCQNQG